MIARTKDANYIGTCASRSRIWISWWKDDCLVTRDPNNLEVLKTVSAAFNKTYSDSPIIATLTQQTTQIDAAYQQYIVNNSGNRVAPEIGLNNPKKIK